MSTTSLPELPLTNLSSATAGSTPDWLQLDPKKQARLLDSVSPAPWLAEIRSQWRVADFSPLLWGIPKPQVDSEIAELADLLLQGNEVPEELLIQTLVNTLETGEAVDRAMVCLSTAYALPDLAASLDAELWWQLVKSLIAVTVPPAADVNQDPLPTIWFGGELPYVLGIVLADLKRPAKQLRKQGASCFAKLADTHLDGTGLPYSLHWSTIRPWLASWTRALELSGAASVEWPHHDSEHAYGWMVRRALQLTRGDGTSMFVGEPVWEAPFLRAVLELSDDPCDVAIADRQELDYDPPETDDDLGDDLPDSTEFSEWAQGVIMRSGWKPNGAHLAIGYQGSNFEIDLAVRRKPLCCGYVVSSVEIDGKSISPAGKWNEICAFSEDGVDYLELELRLQSNWRLQRKWMFSRRERLIFIADAILGKRDANIEARLELPFASQVAWEAEAETEDGWLVAGGERQAWIAPLSAPEWKTDSNRPAITTVRDSLVTTHAARGSALFLPLLIDMKGGRRKESLRTWRQLTVAERLRIVDPHEAVGYRVQVGRKQWLFYRSLAPAANRTVLGQNFVTEFFAGRFHRSGEAVPYVEVESD